MKALPIPLPKTIADRLGGHLLDDNAPAPLTISDIAGRAGVSVTTVSRVLNKKPDVSAKTATNVKAVMQELGYQPQASARRLAAGRASVIAVLPHESSSSEPGSITYEYLTGIVDGAEEEEFAVSLLPRGTSPDRLKALLSSGQFDGLVLLHVQTNDWRVDVLRNAGKPFVLIGRTENTHDVSYVGVGMRAASNALMKQVFAAGHRNVAFIGNSLSSPVRVFSATLFSDGYHTSMNDAGLEPHVIDAEFSVEGIVDAISQGRAEKPETTCFFIGGHVVMPQVLSRLQAQGISVPDDISLVSILPASTAEMVSPQLSAIDFPGQELGREASKILLDQVLRNIGTVQKLLTPQIVWRDSVLSLEPKE